MVTRFSPTVLAFLILQAPLLAADQPDYVFLMIGRQMLGKIVFKVAEALGKVPEEFAEEVSLGGRDVVMAGDVKQAQPVGE